MLSEAQRREHDAARKNLRECVERLNDAAAALTNAEREWMAAVERMDNVTVTRITPAGRAALAEEGR